MYFLYLFFFSMIPPPLLSTLFPYTTLFRSFLIDEAQDLSTDALQTIQLLTNLQTAGQSVLQVVLVGGPDIDQRLNSDRKSTRLNSSHRCISYAVFCLKKKKNKNNHRK